LVVARPSEALSFSLIGLGSAVRPDIASSTSAAVSAGATISELRVHAIYLRDLRNYGLHPRSTSDNDRYYSSTCS